MEGRLQALITTYESEMSGYPASLQREFQRALDSVSALLQQGGDLERWAEEGVALARQSLRSWETAAEYFRVAPLVLRLGPLDGFRRWAETGRELAAESATLATAYFRAGPAGLER